MHLLFIGKKSSVIHPWALPESLPKKGQSFLSFLLNGALLFGNIQLGLPVRVTASCNAVGDDQLGIPVKLHCFW